MGKRNKTKTLVSVGLVLLLMIIMIIASLNENQLTSTKRLADQYGGSIKRVVSQNDTDGDGIDDQTDILSGALAYIATRPRYESRYYETGYPNDGYGVCTDVVGFALKGAGFDLKRLVAEDIAENPADYDVPEPDENIDFRRVRNLRVYFKNHAVELTTDLTEIEKWQGGDIVIFEGHIGIVSDGRNAQGIPYVIHHSNPSQMRYEEDILPYRDDIVGHYRMSKTGN